MQLFFSFLARLIHWVQPLLVPVCLVVAWGFVLLVGWSIWSAARDTVKSAQRMHQIPCAQCRFFTGTYYLKCPVHPFNALSERAINCKDFEEAPRAEHFSELNRF